MRVRPADEWIWADAPDLRIVPQDLWEQVQSRRRNRRSASPGSTIVPKPKYLFSGLLVCAECGCRYTLQDSRPRGSLCLFGLGEPRPGCVYQYEKGEAGPS
jgi:hypothetical protein